MPLVSIILPTFDTPIEILRRALTSALAQSHGNVEVVLIDDGSSREFAARLPEVARDDPRVRLVRQENQGVSAARNVGLDQARGDFVCYLDSDDYLDRDFVRSALELLLAWDADVVFGEIEVVENGPLPRRKVPPVARVPRVVEGAALDRVRSHILAPERDDWEDGGVRPPKNVVGCLFSGELARGARFPYGIKHAEDQLYNLDVLAAARRAGFVPDRWYTYDRSRSTSVTRSLSADTVPDLLRTIEAFARAGGVMQPSLVRAGSDPNLRQSAADGAARYLRLAVTLAASTPTHAEGLDLVRAIIRSPGVAEVVRASAPRSGREWLFSAAARLRSVPLLVALGRLQGARLGAAK